MTLSSIFPILDWIKTYNKQNFTNDFIASIIVTIMLIPQSMAYAMLAGLPPIVGLYASILPLIFYAIFGSSRALAVGPVAVISLMTAAAINAAGYTLIEDQIAAAITLATMSGIFLVILGVFRFGFIANLLSHPVIAAFITASAILIAISQLKHVLGIEVSATNLKDILLQLYAGISQINLTTALIGFAGVLFLFWVRSNLKPILQKTSWNAHLIEAIVKTGPVLAVALAILITYKFSLNETKDVKIVGELAKGFPPFAIPSFNLEMVQRLIPSAIILSLVGFVESISVAQSLASKKRQRIQPNQELIALGAANIASGFSGGYPITGGFARSVVNFDAGAQTPLAGAMTAVLIAITTLYFTPLFYYLPRAILAATIIVAVLSLVDIRSLWTTWQYRKADGIAAFLTIIAVLTIGIEPGIILGVLASLTLHILHTGRPHIAVVGLVPETEHFRNIHRHDVKCCTEVITLRIDESLYFLNSRFLEDEVNRLAATKPDLQHVILMCSAVNEIDSSALESLDAICDHLKAGDIKLHLSEVKGPVMDRLKDTHFLKELTGEIYLSQYQAIQELSPATVET
jgi:SulP family sulfate permease